MIAPFTLSGLPQLIFGHGSAREIPALVRRYGRRVLIVTGARSFIGTAAWPQLQQGLQQQGIAWLSHVVAGEPSPQEIDMAVARYRQEQIEVVIGIGGGSVLDAAKAMAGLLPHGNSVMDHLEGVGPELPYTGPALPFIAVPTTAGTGSEATKNAVLSVQGEAGFKKSFRHDLLVARYAVVDPDLLASCPPHLIAANGMDALTQLLESYVSARANPFTDALALSGLAAVRDSLLVWYRDGAAATAAQAGMAYGAFLSGITLAQVGLGSVHGLAAPLGAFFPIPHGEACGTLVAEATDVNIRALTARAGDHPSYFKYAEAGRLMTKQPALPDDEAHAALVSLLREWTRIMAIPKLESYRLTAGDIPRVVANCRGSSMKTNPVVLSDDEVAEILGRRI